MRLIDGFCTTKPHLVCAELTVYSSQVDKFKRNTFPELLFEFEIVGLCEATVRSLKIY